MVKGGLYVEIDPFDHYFASALNKPGKCWWYCGVAVRVEVSKLSIILHFQFKSSFVFNFFLKIYFYNVLQLILQLAIVSNRWNSQTLSLLYMFIF